MLRKIAQATACDTCEHAFTTLQGQPLGHRYVQRMVKRYVVKAGIDKNVSPHTLRHSFATDLYRETSKIRLVQKVLGHSALFTTMIYTHIFDEEVVGMTTNKAHEVIILRNPVHRLSVRIQRKLKVRAKSLSHQEQTQYSSTYQRRDQLRQATPPTQYSSVQV